MALRRRGLGYYRQFEELTPEEISAEFRRRAEERRATALTRIEAIDLSGTAWHELPHPDVVVAITYAARGGLNREPDPYGTGLRREIARRSALEPERIALGNGAGELLRAAAEALLGPGDELLCPWPSYPLYPALARRVGAQAVPVTAPGIDALLAAVTPSTRMVVVCRPNDPTGAWTPTADLRRLAEGLPEQAWLVVDEALVELATVEDADGALELLEEHERLLVVRSFSKGHGLAGLKLGVAFGAYGDAPRALLERLAPPLGVSTLALEGGREAVRLAPALVKRRRTRIAAERERLVTALAPLPVDAAPSEANFLWLRATRLTGSELAARLGRHGVVVRDGTDLGAPDHIRVQIRDADAGERLLTALGRALADGDAPAPAD